MIIIQAEDGAIVTNPKKIYIDNDLNGHLHIYADLSSTDRVKAVELTAKDYSKEVLVQMLDTMHKKMNKWLFFDACPHCVIRMDKMRYIARQERMEAAHEEWGDLVEERCE